MQDSAIRPSLTYATMEKLRVAQPIDRLAWIADACEGKFVLDIGCYDETALMKRGTPHWLHGRIVSRAARVVGLDIADVIPEAGVRTGVNAIIHRRDAASLDVDGLDVLGVDVIVAGEFIEHLECPLGFLREVKRQYDGCELIVSTPNGVCFANALMGSIGREVQHPDHLHNFTYKTLNTLCMRAGFRSWDIIPYRFYATEMIMASRGPRKALVVAVQSGIRLVEWLFPLLSFGYIVRARV